VATITEKDLCGITEGPLTIHEFFAKPWKQLCFPEDLHPEHSYQPARIDFFAEKITYERNYTPEANLNLLQDLLQRWREKTSAVIYAIILYGDCVRQPKVTIETYRRLFWRKEKKVVERISPTFVNGLLISDANEKQVAYLKSRHRYYGTDEYAAEMVTMGYSISSLTLATFNKLVGQDEAESDIPNTVMRTGVLIAGECEFSPLFGNERTATWNERFWRCSIS